MKFDQTDRRRVVFASIVTLVALPSVWWSNETRTVQSGVAAVGVDAGHGAATPITGAPTTTVVTPAYLTPITTIVPPPTAPTAATGSGSDVMATGTATYRSGVGRGWCEVSGVRLPERVTIVNSASGRAVDCRVDPVGGAGVTVVLSRAGYAEIADFTDAPIHVEVRR